MDEIIETKNETKIELNEYIELKVLIPSETDIATFDGITEMVRKITRAAGTILPTRRKRIYTSINAKWDEKLTTEFIEDFNVKKLSVEKIMKKYDLKTTDPNNKNFIQKKIYYLKMKFNIK